MQFNWLDVILLSVLLISFILGIVTGLVRQIVGIAAIILGLILAITYYPSASEIFLRWISNETVAQLLGFLLIFVGVLCVGGICSWLLSKVMKGPLKFLNHLLGAVLGLVQGVLICGVVVFALLVFPVNMKALKESQLAPHCLRITRLAYSLIPGELKDRFKDAYYDVMKKERRDAKKA